MSDTPETDKVEQYVQRDINRKWVLSDFAKRIERERDELKEKIKSLTSPAIECVLTRMRGNLEIVDRIKIERDELRAEVEQLKSERENWRVSSVCRELQSEVERLKADKSRLDFCDTIIDLELGGYALHFPVKESTTIRGAIDAAMKGDK